MKTAKQVYQAKKQAIDTEPMPDGRKRKRKLETTTADKPQIKKTRGRDIAVDITINDNECCMCFGTHDDDVLEGSGAEWISCACGRWSHEDCIEDCIVDENGEERVCPF